MWKYLIGGYLAITVLPAVVTVGVPAAFKAARKAVRPKIRGVSGEAKVNRCLKKFKGNEFATARDVMLLAHEKTSQIDNLLISPYGVFVIETKNYVGFVDGKKDDPRWEHIPPGSRGRIRSFYNPIWQNNGHIKALRELLKDSYPGLKFYNVVAFSNSCVLPDIDGVVNFRNLQKFLKNKMTGEPRLSDKDVADIKEIIEKNNIKEWSKRSEHVAFARYMAGWSKEQERQAEVRQRAEENKEMAMRVQMLYAQGRSGGLDGKVEMKTPVKEKEPLVDLNQTEVGKKDETLVEKKALKINDSVREGSSELLPLGSQIQAANKQKKEGHSVDQVVKQDIFFEL